MKTILMLAIAGLLSSCSTSSERVKANEWYLDLVYEKNHRFNAHADSASTLRERFRVWNACYGRFDIEEDSPTELRTAWPREEGKDGGYRLSMMPFADSVRVTVETSDDLGLYGRAFALYIRRGILPPSTDFLYRDCASPTPSPPATE